MSVGVSRGKGGSEHSLGSQCPVCLGVSGVKGGSEYSLGSQCPVCVGGSVCLEGREGVNIPWAASVQCVWVGGCVWREGRD